MQNKLQQRYYHLMMMPGVVLLIIFNIIPMFGLILAFQKFVPAKGVFGSSFVGLYNFKLLFMYSAAKQAILNTLIIASAKIVLGVIVPVSFAVLLNEVKSVFFKRTVQTIIYLPNFLSWVILAIMFNNIFSYNGIANKFIALFNAEPQLFMVSNRYFRQILIGTDVWKTFGYGAIIYLAAITTIDPNMYEAAAIDGAGRWRRIFHIVLPSIAPIVVLMTLLSLGNILNAGFDQVYNMYSTLVYETGDIIDTYVYRMGLEKLQYSFGTAVGLFKSVVSFILLASAYKLAQHFTDYSFF